jgi:hypothetical protein
MNYITHVKDSIEKAEKLESKLSEEVINIDGMVGLKTRHFYNNLLSMEHSKYLEIGCLLGASTCAAMYNNNAFIVCIDNFSEFGNNKDKLLDNINKYKGINKVIFIEDDCFNINLNNSPKFNIYLYDGNHSYESQYKALTYYYDFLEDIFILIIDDWNWTSTVEKGTRNAIKDLNLTILYEKEIKLTNDGSTTPLDIAKNTWWNGISIAVLSKTKI